MRRELYWGDNLEVLQHYIADESIDLIYLDPPFNSNRNYNVLFRDDDRHESDAQIEAFTDTWHWSEPAEKTYKTLVEGNHVPQEVSDLIVAMRSFIGSNDVMAYLVMTTIRLIELHRVLKPSGSIYLHCDPTASHYLKVVMDTIWGPKRFLNEIIWRRSSAHSDSRQGMKRCGRIHDVILVYSKSQHYTWNTSYTPYTKEYLESEYDHQTDDGRYFTDSDLTANKGGGNTSYEWRVKRKAVGTSAWEADLEDEYLNPRADYDYLGVQPYRGRFWAYSKANLVQFAKSGKLFHRKTGMPRLMNFADEMPGIPLQDVWDDIPPALGKERLGYDTQKPAALLERIIHSSSNEGDVVLDPFCGCGTAVEAAEKLNRRWIGIDVTHLAISLIVSRMKEAFPDSQIDRHGEPRDVGGARALAELDRYDFQNWALALVAARPVKGGKKGADRGVDGVISLLGFGTTPERCLVQVKSGHVNVSVIRDLRGTVERERADMGLLITLEKPTPPMNTEAIEAGFYQSEWSGQDYPKIQIVTIEELLSGKKPEIPPLYSPFKLAQRRQRQDAKQPGLFERRLGT